MRWGLGFGLAAGTGLAAGLLLGWWRALNRVTMPVIYVLQLIPGLAWIPIALLLFGVGERATIFMIFVTALAPVVINTVAGVRGVDPGYVRAAQMMGAVPRSLFFRVLLPAAVPHLLSGLRVGLANGWRVLVAAEMIVGTGTGLGYSILQARWTLDYASSFACILVIVALGLAVEKLGFAPLERKTAERWGVARG
jgi:ABC-type nitrate/sulfonate/bicarbonate transport system permease component